MLLNFAGHQASQYSYWYMPSSKTVQQRTAEMFEVVQFFFPTAQFNEEIRAEATDENETYEIELSDLLL